MYRKGTLVHYEQTVMDRVTRPGRRVCPGTLVGYEQTVRERVGRPWAAAGAAASLPQAAVGLQRVCLPRHSSHCRPSFIELSVKL